MSMSIVYEFQRICVTIKLEMSHCYLMDSRFSPIMGRNKQNTKDKEQTIFVKQWQTSAELQYKGIETISLALPSSLSLMKFWLVFLTFPGA